MARATLLVTIALGLIFGTFSTLFFFWRWVAGPPPAVVVWLQIAGSTAFVMLLLKGALPRTGRSFKAPLVPALIAAGLILSAAALLLIYCLNQPHGEWDAWAIWNLHARFLFRGGAQWTDMFRPELYWSHHDYPFLLPALIAAGWTMAGAETTVIPNVLGYIFGVGTVTLLLGATCFLQRGWRGLAAGVVLVSMPDFVLHGAYQAADIPLAFYFLLTLVLVQLSDVCSRGRFLFMAGMAAAFSAWTKNEGLLFVVALAAAWLVSTFITRSREHIWKDAMRLASGAAPFLLLIVVLKLWVVPRNDLFMQPDTFSSKLLDLSRYRTIAEFLGRELSQLGGGPVNAAFGLAALIAFTGIGARRVRPGTAEVCTLLVVLFMSAGYFMVYVITPMTLEWHLDSSLERLVLQLWPLAVLAAACFATPPSAMPGAAFAQVRQTSSRALQAAGGALVLLGALLPFLLSMSPQQAATNSRAEGEIKHAASDSIHADAVVSVELIDSGPLRSGFAELKDSDAVAILSFRTGAGIVSEVNLTPMAPASAAVIPFRNGEGYRTSIALTNTAGVSTDVTISIRGGKPSVIRIPGKGQIAGFIDDHPFGIHDAEGSMDVRSSAGNIIVSAFLTATVPDRGFYMAGLPVASGPVSAGRVFRIPRPSGQDIVGDLYLLNASASAVSGKHRVIDRAGRIVHEGPYRIQPRDSVRIGIDGIGEGNIELVPENDMPSAAALILTARTDGIVSHLASIGAAAAGTNHNVFVESARNSKTETEIEIANNGTERAEVEIDLAGLTSNFSVPPNGSLNVPVKNLKGFPWQPDPLRDIVFVKSNHPVTVTAFRWFDDAGDRRLMAAYGQSGRGRFFPYFALGSGFGTNFILSGAGTLNFVDSSGKPLEVSFRRRTSQ